MSARGPFHAFQM